MAVVEGRYCDGAGKRVRVADGWQLAAGREKDDELVQ